MNNEHIPILEGLVRKKNKGVPGGGHSLYYYQGNFYYPDDLAKDSKRVVKIAIKMFKDNHRAMVDNDRGDPEYKTLVELFDLEFPNG